MLNLFKPKTMDRNKVYDEPQITGIPIERRRLNYDFEIISGSVWDTEGNEYLTKEQALSKGVPENRIVLEPDFMDEHVCLAYRYEKSYQDKVNVINAKKAGFGVIRMLQGENKDAEYMYCLYDTTRALNLVAYAYLTHKYVEKGMLKQIKKDKQYQNELMFVVGEFGGEALFNQIMNYAGK